MTSSPASAATVLADYAAGLQYGDIPPRVLRRAKDCIIDTVAAVIYGAAAQPAQIVLRMIRAEGSGAGRSRILAPQTFPVRAENAALANGILAHAFELDSLRKPGVGVHPGAILVPAAVAAAQERGLGGKAVLTAFVAGCEVMFRIGKATKHSAEERGFHAPGLTGPFGAAVAAGKIFGLDAEGLRNALGIAGSLGGGLLEFAAKGEGSMVKRLHLGRAAANGIVAARLAEGGFAGPGTVLEGRYGFLNGYCEKSAPGELTAGLGETFETMTICLKRYACHITAHTPVYAIEKLRAEHGFDGTDVRRVLVEGTPKMARLHAEREPADSAMAQYSIAFCAAVALLRDPLDPDNFTGNAVQDAGIRDLCRRVEVEGTANFESSWATRIHIELSDGRTLSCTMEDCPGTPTQPFNAAQLERKFDMLSRRIGTDAAPLRARLEAIEAEETLDWLGDAGG